MSEPVKHCPACGLDKPLTAFSVCRSERDGRRYECRDCDRQRNDGSHVTGHGYSGYTHGCRCDICRKAKAAYMAERRQAAYRADHPVPAGIRHGTAFAYEEHGCRCEFCVIAEKNAPRHRRTAGAA